MPSNLELIESLMEAVNRRDIDHMMSFFTEDSIYHPLPVGLFEGPQEIRQVLQGMLDMAKEHEWIVHHVAESSDGTVFNERTDRFLIHDKWVEIRCTGVFGIVRGKVAFWHSYFDLDQFQSQIADV